MTVAMDPEEDGSEPAVEKETPETILLKRLDSKLVQSAIDGLPVHHREILLLCEVEEMSYQEIAEVLSIPIGTVMSRLAELKRQFAIHSVAPPLNKGGKCLTPSKRTRRALGLWKQRKPPGVMKGVPIDPDFAAERDRLPLDLTGWRSSPGGGPNLPMPKPA